jgi:release factor glutamine methyltransferase
MKALDKLREISKTLSASGIESAEKETEFLVREGLDISLTDLYKENPEVTEEQDAAIEEMVNRRSAREPLQYILGHTDFLGLKILVGEGVLIPRPETELMAEYVIKTIQNSKLKIQKQTTSDERRTTNDEKRPTSDARRMTNDEKRPTSDARRMTNDEKRPTSDARRMTNDEKRPTSDARRMTILDLCTGSGCLALALAKEFPDALVHGTDISVIALKYAKENAGINGVENVEFLKGHLFDPLKQNQLFDLIISNPPYIRTKDIDGLQPEIREWEPVNALDGGTDGLDLYREIVPSAERFLTDGGILVLELGADCPDEVRGIFEHSGYSEIEVLKDYAGIERIIHAKWTR